MKMWWVALIAVALCVSTASAAEVDEIPIKGPDGKTTAVLVLCSDCKEGPGKKGCENGAEMGFRKGKPCGTCLLKANPTRLIEHPYDIHISGTLTDPDGRPLQDRFVKILLPNGWGHRTRTFDKGIFRVILGATAERTAKNPVMIDIGTHVDSKKDDSDAYFAVFMLPPKYKGCEAGDVAAAEADAKAKAQAPQPEKK